MKLLYRFTVLAFGAAMGFSAFAQQSSQTVNGRWQGSLKVPNQEPVGIVVDLSKNAQGAWLGLFSMPEIGATDIPVEQLSVAQTKVHFTVSAIPGAPTFDGNLSADGKELTGTLMASGSKSPLTFKRAGATQVKAPSPNSPLPKEFEGTWHATLEPENSHIRVLLKLARAPDGTATGAVVNVDQANREVPMTTIHIKDKVLEFEIRSVAVRFHGTLNATGRTIVGEWAQMQRTAPLTFERGGFPPNSPLTSAFEGTWLASLDGGENNKIVLALKLTRGADGAAVGTLKNTTEAGKELPVTTITLKDKSMELMVQDLMATFSGTLNAAGTEIAGTWVQARTGLPVTFKRSK